MKPALAPSPPALIDDAAAQRAVRHVITRHFFGTAAVVALLAALVFVFLPAGIAPGARWPLVLAFCALAALAATSMRAGATRMEDLVALVVIAVDRRDHAGRDAARLGHRRAGLRLLRADDLHGLRGGRAAPGRAGGGAQRAGGAEPGLCAVPPVAAGRQRGDVDRKPGSAHADPPDRHRQRPGRRPAGVARGLRLRARRRGARAALPRPADHRRRRLLGDRRPVPAGHLQAPGPRRPARWARPAPSARCPGRCPNSASTTTRSTCCVPTSRRASPSATCRCNGWACPARCAISWSAASRGVRRRRRSWATGAWPATSAPTCGRRQALAATEIALPGAVHAHPDAAGAAHAGARARRQPGGAGHVRLSPTCRPWSARTCWRVFEGGDSRERARRRARGAAADGRPARRCRWPSSASPRSEGGRIVVRATGVRAGHAGRAGGAVDLRRRHRAQEGRGRGAPLRGDAVAPGGHQPRRASR